MSDNKEYFAMSTFDDGFDPSNLATVADLRDALSNIPDTCKVCPTFKSMASTAIAETFTFVDGLHELTHSKQLAPSEREKILFAAFVDAQELPMHRGDAESLVARAYDATKHDELYLGTLEMIVEDDEDTARIAIQDLRNLRKDCAENKTC